MYDLLHVEMRDTEGLKPFQLRKNGNIPGVVFGKGMDSVPVKFDTNEFRKILVHGVKVFEVEIEGQGKHLVNLESVQRDPVSHKVLHVNFHKLNKNQATTVLVPIRLVGDAPGMKEGGVMRQLLDEVNVVGLPHKIPEHIDVDVAGLNLNEHINVSDVKLAAGLSFSEADLEKGIVNCTVPKQVVESEVEEAIEAAEGEEAAPVEEAKAEENKEEKAS